MIRPIFPSFSQPLLIAALFFCSTSPVLAEAIVETDIDQREWPLRVHIIVQPPQVQMLGTSPDGKNRNYGFLVGLGYPDYPAIATATTVLQAALLLSDKSKKTRIAKFGEQHSLLKFNFDAAVSNIFERIDDQSDWELLQLETIYFEDPETGVVRRRTNAKRILKSGITDVALFFKFAYYFSPELNQIRLLAESQSFTKGREGNVGGGKNRNYEYLSPSYGVALRPWRDGERSELEAAINSIYGEKVAENPQNEKVYRLERQSALAAIEDNQRIPKAQAIAEFWTDDRLHVALKLATRHMKFMLHRDLQSLFSSDDYDRSKRLTIDHLDRDGNARRIRVQQVGELDEQTIYRGKFGFLYSIPGP